MKARRLISVGLSAALLMGLTACTDEEPAVGGNKPSATQAVPATTSGVPSTMKEDDKEAMAGIEVKDAKKLENPTVKWLSFWDINPVNGKAVPVHLEMFENVYGGKSAELLAMMIPQKESAKSSCLKIINGQKRCITALKQFRILPKNTRSSTSMQAYPHSARSC